MTHKAVLLFHEKVEHSDGEIVEIKAWAVTFRFLGLERTIGRFTQEVIHLRRRMT